MNSKLIMSLALIGSGLFSLSPVKALDEDGKCCATIEIGLTGGWFATNSADTVYGINSQDRAAPPTGQVLELNPRLRFGGGFDIHYQMPECCYYWAASYYWHRDGRDGNGAGNIAMTSVPARLGFVTDTYADSVSSCFRSHFDFGDVELGSSVCVLADCLLMHPRVGLSYARITENQTTRYVGLAGQPADSFENVELLSSYKGFGPSLGTDLRYLFGGGFSLIGNFRYSALIGSLGTKYTATATVTEGNSRLDLARDRQFVSLVQSELGIGYSFELCGYCGNLSGGYYLTKAFDAIKKVTLPDSNLSGLIISRPVNSSYHGPFLRVSMKFGA